MLKNLIIECKALQSRVFENTTMPGYKIMEREFYFIKITVNNLKNMKSFTKGVFHAL